MESIPRTQEDIEAQIREIQSKKKEYQKTTNNEGVSLLDSGNFYDSDLYDGSSGKGRFEGYNTSIAAHDEADEDEDEGLPPAQKRVSYTAPRAALKDIIQGKDDFDPLADRKRPTIADREDEYRQKRRRLAISPERADPFADGHLFAIIILGLRFVKCPSGYLRRTEE